MNWVGSQELVVFENRRALSIDAFLYHVDKIEALKSDVRIIEFKSAITALLNFGAGSLVQLGGSPTLEVYRFGSANVEVQTQELVFSLATEEAITDKQRAFDLLTQLVKMFSILVPSNRGGACGLALDDMGFRIWFRFYPDLGAQLKIEEKDGVLQQSSMVDPSVFFSDSKLVRQGISKTTQISDFLQEATKDLGHLTGDRVDPFKEFNEPREKEFQKTTLEEQLEQLKLELAKKLEEAMVHSELNKEMQTLKSKLKDLERENQLLTSRLIKRTIFGENAPSQTPTN